MAYTKAMDSLIQEFMKFPGIGQRSAERMAFHVIRMPSCEIESMATALQCAKSTIRHCARCNNLCESQLCGICSSSNRQKEVICIVENPKDVWCIESAGVFKGLYHVLLGIISPLDGVGPEELHIQDIYTRVVQDKVKEVIFALNSGIEGEATILSIYNLLKPLGLKMTRIAAGIPIGMSLEYVDHATISQSLEGRRELL